MKNKIIYYQDIGLVPYQEAFEMQTRLFEQLKQSKSKLIINTGKILKKPKIISYL